MISKVTHLSQKIRLQMRRRKLMIRFTRTIHLLAQVISAFGCVLVSQLSTRCNHYYN